MTVGRLALAAILLAFMAGATCDAGGGEAGAGDATPTEASVLAATPTVVAAAVVARPTAPAAGDGTCGDRHARSGPDGCAYNNPSADARRGAGSRSHTDP